MWRSNRSPADAVAAAAAALGRRARRGWCVAARTARLAIGIPDYEAYVAHVRAQHPGMRPMDRGAFFAERMQARYGRGRTRCC
jgi:uncharacterized short protein YbdD (DUF466 family)